jgi:hypothetical protein
MEQYIELIALVLVLIFSFLLYYVIFSKMKEEMVDFTWDQYFVKCGIYQGKSHWTTIRNYLLRLSR